MNETILVVIMSSSPPFQRRSKRRERIITVFVSVYCVPCHVRSTEKELLNNHNGCRKGLCDIGWPDEKKCQGCGEEEGLGNTGFSIAQLGGKLGTRSLIGHHHHASITTGSAHEANTECLFRSLVHHAADASKPPMATCLLSQRFWCVTGFRHTPRCCIHFAFIRPRGKK